MAKRKVIRAYARHKVCGHVMEPFDLEINKDMHLRFESDGSAIFTETGRVPRLVTTKNQAKNLRRMLVQAARQTRCLHCEQDVVLTSTKDAEILDLILR
jgi:hypothetical protein